MKYAETLSPGTDALPSNTVEMVSYHGAYLVRVRNRHGMTLKKKFPLTIEGKEDAHRWMLEQAHNLLEESNP